MLISTSIFMCTYIITQPLPILIHVYKFIYCEFVSRPKSIYNNNCPLTGCIDNLLFLNVICYYTWCTQMILIIICTYILLIPRCFLRAWISGCNDTKSENHCPSIWLQYLKKKPYRRCSPAPRTCSSPLSCSGSSRLNSNTHLSTKTDFFYFLINTFTV